MKYLAAVAVVMAATACNRQADDPEVKAATDLARRIAPELVKKVEFVNNNDSIDGFRLYQSGKKVTIEGNNANSMAVGLNHYLKYVCLTEVTWYRTNPVELPKVLPDVVDTVSATALVPNRFFLNYCTFGYSMPWWSWDDWERFIDWMALNGVNLPLAITGQESIWYNVWSKLGLDDETIRGYFTGPAHLPWHRMCNLDGWQGPLPKEWLDDQSELQKRIVERERSLNMRPVLPAFAGHVPGALAELFPDARITEVGEWGGFPSEYGCSYLSPTDSLFNVIQREYLEEQTRLYGTNHVYGVDPFNEVSPPTWQPDSLAMLSKGIYESLAEVDPDAVWLQMAWLFWADQENWTPKRVQAYLQGVPEGRMILLDYYCEMTEEWKLFDKFYGQPYIWCYLGNFGGNSFLASPLNDVGRRLDDVLENGGSNLVGIGSTLEGLDLNPYMYEYVLDRAWSGPLGHDEIVTGIIDRRVGAVDSTARAAWRLLVDSVFISPSLCGQGPLVNARPSLEGFSWWTTKPNIDYANSTLVDAWGALLDVESGRDTYQFDIVNLGRQALSNHFITLRDRFASAYCFGFVESYLSAADEMKELLRDLTTLLRSHPDFSMRKWIDDARAKGTTPSLQDYFERNARTLVTIWGVTKDLNDYANRQWAELNDQYYAARWIRFIDYLLEPKPLPVVDKLDYEAFYTRIYDRIRDFENGWIRPSNPIRFLEMNGDKSTVRKIYEKWAPRIKADASSYSSTDCISLHHW